jgi:hypothetical protein
VFAVCPPPKSTLNDVLENEVLGVRICCSSRGLQYISGQNLVSCEISELESISSQESQELSLYFKRILKNRRTDKL